VIVVLLVIAQLVLPGIAAQRLRDRLSRYGTVRSVEVSAFPAIELLWHQADSVTIVLDSYRSPSTQAGALLAQAGDVGSLDVRAAQVDLGLLRLQDAVVRKRGQTLTASATVTEAAVQAAVPFLQSVTPVASGGGALTLRGTATVLGAPVSADATVAAAPDGSVTLTPDVPLGGLATLTLFADPHLAVESVSAQPRRGGFTVTASGLLR
jgi:hypothetical protein